MVITISPHGFESDEAITCHPNLRLEVGSSPNHRSSAQLKLPAPQTGGMRASAADQPWHCSDSGAEQGRGKKTIRRPVGLHPASCSGLSPAGPRQLTLSHVCTHTSGRITTQYAATDPAQTSAPASNMRPPDPKSPGLRCLLSDVICDYSVVVGFDRQHQVGSWTLNSRREIKTDGRTNRHTETDRPGPSPSLITPPLAAALI